MGCIRVSSSYLQRGARLLVGGLLVLGVVLGFAVARGDAAPAAGTGYAYNKAAPAAGEAATLVNASANRDDEGTSPVKVLVLVGVGAVIVGGAVFEGVYVRRRGGAG